MMLPSSMSTSSLPHTLNNDVGGLCPKMEDPCHVES